MAPLIVDRAKGSRLIDRRGRSFIDGVSSLWVTAHGHRHPALDRAVRRQLGKVAHSTFLGLTHEPAIRLGRALAGLAPRGLTRVFYSDNGATAVEVALKMAFQFNLQRPGGDPSRTEFVALENSYHGDTLGAVSVGGIGAFHKIFKPLIFKARFAPTPSCFHCPHRKKSIEGSLRAPTDALPSTPLPGQPRPETGCRWECLSGAEKVLHGKGGERPPLAAIVEPMIQGAAGMRVMPPGYLRGFARLCREAGVLLIADEVATGFGRTGRMFAVEHEGVVPDFLCVAKALTGGYLPLAATLTSEKVFDAFRGRYDQFKTFFHGHSYTANPLACSAALENLAIYRREKTLARLAPKIRALTEFLRENRGRPGVADVRQMGFMAGIELREPVTGKPFPAGARVGARVCRAALERGVWIRPLGDTVVILPPLGISSADLRQIFRAVSAALKEAVG
jgi:adenosylmethionine-8-amino-7-oxononanoate transaminase